MTHTASFIWSVLRNIMLCCILLILLLLQSCQQDIISDNPTLQLRFSHDSLLFDTVFTQMGSSTKRMMIYNPHKNALLIDRVEMKHGKSFYMNLDGENQMERYYTAWGR